MRESSLFGMPSIIQEEIKAGMEAANFNLKDSSVDYRHSNYENLLANTS